MAGNGPQPTINLGTCPKIVTRSEWGARAPISSGVMSVPVSNVVIHHTAGVQCSDKNTCMNAVRQIQNQHMDTNKWADIGYNFLVGGDGHIYEGRGFETPGAHAQGYNSKSIGVSFMGNFDKEPPNSAMIGAAKDLVQCGVAKNILTENPEIIGHRDTKSTACPGTALYKDIQGWAGFKGGK